MEETWAESTPFSFETWHSRVSRQQSKNIILQTNHSINPLDNIFAVYSSCIILTWMYNCCISLGGTLLHGLILCLHARNWLSRLEQSWYQPWSKDHYFNQSNYGDFCFVTFCFLVSFALFVVFVMSLKCY
jgi:hypothetical protein